VAEPAVSSVTGASGSSTLHTEVRARSTDDLPLHDWLLAHGPLSPGAALALVLKACATASALRDAQLAAALPSLTTASLRRSDGQGWTWVPSPGPGRPVTVADAEVIERLGAVLFECLTAQSLAQRFDDEQMLLTRLRGLRPDLPLSVAELTARAATPRRRGGSSLDEFASELRTVMGTARRPSDHGRRAMVAATLVAMVVVTAIALVGARRWRAAPLASHGLTADDTMLLDIKLESADYLAVIGEHTAAIQELQELERLWFGRVSLSDPRLAWSRTRQAWVRELSGDHLTAEQLLEPYLLALKGSLGPAHPYTRTLQLDLAAVVEARGAREHAAALRAEAAQVMTDLVRSPALAWGTVGLPWPPHTIAHVAPNAPEREGFRLTPGRGYEVPLTSTQRWFAGRDGWHLHVRATSTCRVSLVAGADPRGIGVDVRRGADGAWAAAVEGSAPQLAVASPAADTFALTLSADTDGRLTVRLADGRTHIARVDAGTTPPSPPYVLALDDDREGAGCGVVWWEIAAR
jgi:hypothetical protein